MTGAQVQSWSVSRSDILFEGENEANAGVDETGEWGSSCRSRRAFQQCRTVMRAGIWVKVGLCEKECSEDLSLA